MDQDTAIDSSLVDVLATVDDRDGSLLSSDDLKTRLSSPDITQYLTHLTSLSLPEILHEPTTLASEASQLTNSLTSLCHTEYPTFLSLHKSSSVLSNTLSSLSSSLTSLIDVIPSLEAQTRQFSAETQAIQETRTKARQVLTHHDALVDILDVPSLIDTCVRNGYYQEAMDLSAHAQRLAERMPDLPIIQDVAAEAAHAMRLMLAQLLTLLREPAKLPALFKAVSFLRKMGTFDERELALVFITSRLVHLNNVLNGIEKERIDHARYIRRYVDAWREGVSDTATQFATIFLERVPSEEILIELRYLLSTLTRHMLDDLLSVLRTHLSQVEDATSLSALLTQLTHCSVALSRAGLDFKSLLPPLFENAVQQRFMRSLNNATDSFCGTLSDAQRYRRQPSIVLCTPDAIASPPDEFILPDALHVPPHVLSSFPPLATYTNSILAALNSLRLLAPASLLGTLLSILDTALERASSEFFGYAQAAVEAASSSRAVVSDEDPPNQTLIVRSSSKAFVRLLLPYVRRALIEGVYNSSDSHDVREGLRESINQWEVWIESFEEEAEATGDS